MTATKRSEAEAGAAAATAGKREVCGSRSRRRQSSLGQTRLPPRKGRKTRSSCAGRSGGPLSLDSPPFDSATALAVNVYILVSLLFLLDGATVRAREPATPQECPASPPRAYLYSLLLRSRLRPYQAWQHPIQLTRTD